MDSGKLAILMPTYRFDAVAIQNILTVAAMGRDDIGIFIGDNSENPEKWEFLRDLEGKFKNIHAFCHTKNIGAFENWLFLLERQSYEYICMASDDDIYSVDYFLAGYEELKSNPECASSCGLFLLVTPGDDRADISTAISLLSPSPVERITNYTGFNPISYAVFRRNNFTAFLSYLKSKPYLAAYNDFFQAYTFLSFGTYVVHYRAPVFVYNNDNWAEADTAWKSSAAFYIRAGLPEQFQYLHSLSWAVEAVHYFRSKYRPSTLSDDEAAAIALLLFHRWFGEFQEQYSLNQAVIDALFDKSDEGLNALKQMLATPYEQNLKLFDQFVAILRAFNSDLAGRYADFVRDSVLPGSEPKPLPVIEADAYGASGLDLDIPIQNSARISFLRRVLKKIMG